MPWDLPSHRHIHEDVHVRRKSTALFIAYHGSAMNNHGIAVKAHIVRESPRTPMMGQDSNIFVMTAQRYCHRSPDGGALTVPSRARHENLETPMRSPLSTYPAKIYTHRTCTPDTPDTPVEICSETRNNEHRRVLCVLCYEHPDAKSTSTTSNCCCVN